MDSCIELAESLLKELESIGDEDHAEIVKGLIDDLKADYEEEDGEDAVEASDNIYESKDSGKRDQNPDKELEEFASSELEKKAKPTLVIRIKK